MHNSDPGAGVECKQKKEARWKRQIVANKCFEHHQLTYPNSLEKP